jgi:2-oxoglutarate ferredoxin oxidoreductase subunit gamma
MLSSMDGAVLLGGIGGQGVQLAARVLATAALAGGHDVHLASEYGGEMRGGPSLAAVTLARDRALRALPGLPPVADSAILLHPSLRDRVSAMLRPGSVVVVNASLVEADPGRTDLDMTGVPGAELAAEAGSAGALCFVLLGAWARRTCVVNTAALEDAMAEVVPPYRRQHVAANAAALRVGAAA